MKEATWSRSEILHGDCLRLLATAPAGVARLAFADPPFNIGYKYDHYDDARTYRDYVDWSRRWMESVTRVLSPDGSFYIAIGDEYAAELRVIGRELGLTLRNWIIWHYHFGQNTRDKFVRAHTHILYFVRDPKRYVFHDDVLRFPSARHTEYGDRRANPAGRLPDDVWNEFPRVCGTFKERQGWHGCQMPEALLTRIVRASSDPGDVVLDPFAGSGTTPATAVKWGRIGIGIESSGKYAVAARDRLKSAMRTAERRNRRDSDGWCERERECLRQLYRETETPVESLVANAAAMECIRHAMRARAEREFTTAEIAAQLRALQGKNDLPKIKNDRPYRARQHRKEAFAQDRKLAESWFAGLPERLRRANEHAVAHRD